MTWFVLYIDGCEQEEYDDILWSEISVRYHANEPCPCTEVVQRLAGRATRFCEGDYVNGAYWSSIVDKSDCVITQSEITKILCTVATVSFRQLHLFLE